MLRSTLLTGCALLAASFGPGRLALAADYNEFILGDLSNDPALPTALSLVVGENILVAQSMATDLDFLRVTVPSNHVLDSIIVEFHDDVNPMYAGVQAGPAWTAGTGPALDPSQTLGWVNFPSDPHHQHTGEDILQAMSLAPDAIGFAPPLVSGQYAFLFQAPSSLVSYGLSFNVTAIGGGELAGDFNDDQIVDAGDLMHWRHGFGSSSMGDADNDNDTDGADLLLWQRNFGATAVAAAAHPMTTAVPEPAAPALAAAAVAAAAWRRRSSTRPRPTSARPR